MQTGCPSRLNSRGAASPRALRFTGLRPPGPVTQTLDEETWGALHREEGAGTGAFTRKSAITGREGIAEICRDERTNPALGDRDALEQIPLE